VNDVLRLQIKDLDLIGSISVSSEKQTDSTNGVSTLLTLCNFSLKDYLGTNGNYH